MFHYNDKTLVSFLKRKKHIKICNLHSSFQSCIAASGKLRCVAKQQRCCSKEKRGEIANLCTFMAPAAAAKNLSRGVLPKTLRRRPYAVVNSYV